MPATSANRRLATQTRRNILGAALGPADQNTLAEIFGCSPADVRDHLLRAVDAAHAAVDMNDVKGMRSQMVAQSDVLAWATVRHAKKNGPKHTGSMLKQITKFRKRIAPNG
jgi:hypothetical protein